MLDLHDFTIPEGNFSGLYKAGDDLAQNRNAVAKAKVDGEAKKAGTAKWLSDFSDPKDHLSGMPTDPEVVKRFGDIQTKGLEYLRSNPGADQNSLLLHLNKDVNELSTYATKAKVIAKKTEEGLKAINENSGYDKKTLQQRAMKNAWYNPDGSVKGVQDVNPDADYISETINIYPEEVTNNSGVDNWLKSQKMVENGHSGKFTNSKGGYEQKSMVTNGYTFAVPETDGAGVSNAKMVPEYDVARDGQTPITHEFTNTKGEKATAEVRMVKPQLYTSILANSPGTKDWLRGQVNMAIKTGDYKDAEGEPIKLNSPQADMLGKVILYDELKARGMGGMKERESVKATPAPRISVTVNNGKKGEDIKVYDLYGKIADYAKAQKERGKTYTQLNLLPFDQQIAALTFVNSTASTDENTKFTQKDIFLDYNSAGEVEIYKNSPGQLKNGDTYLGILPETATNTKVQPTAKGKYKVTAKGDNPATLKPSGKKSPQSDPLGIF